MSASDKKQVIVDAAVSVLARKGKNATISEIASAAGVNDSIIYHYFENKTDLLFHAAGKSIQHRLADLEHHLEGIREPVSRLSKLIWYQLTYHDDEPGYARFSIFYCRTNQAFFRHEASVNFINWIQVLHRILKDGVEDGSFSDDISLSIVNAMVLGVLDISNIQAFTGQWKENAKEDFEAILDLILAVLNGRSPAKKDASAGQDRRTMILTGAERVFAEKSFDKATTIDIARASGVAEGTLYEYFKGKQDILFSCLSHRFNGHIDEIENLFTIITPPERLARFMRKHFFLYLKNPQFANTFISGGIYNEAFYKSLAYKDFSNYLKIIDEILEEGKRGGFFRPEIDARIFKNLFVGCFSQLLLRWSNSSPRSYYDTVYAINRSVELLLRSVMKAAS